MNEIIDKIWELNINLESGPELELTRLIDKAQQMNDSDDLANLIYEKSKGENLDKVVYILNATAWCGSDNGAALSDSLNSWLYGSNENKIYIALNTEFYPFVEASEMYACLSKLATKFPRFSNRCNHLIQSRMAIKHA